MDYQSAVEAFLLQRHHYYPRSSRQRHYRSTAFAATTSSSRRTTAMLSSTTANQFQSHQHDQQQQQQAPPPKQHHPRPTTSSSNNKRSRQTTTERSSSSSNKSMSNCELSENDKMLRLCIDLPGVTAQDVHVSVLHGSILCVQAQRKSYSMDGQACLKTQTLTRHYGFDPAVLDVEKTQANLYQGVLTIVAPKKAPVPPSLNIPVTQLDDENEPVAVVTSTAAAAAAKDDIKGEGRDDTITTLADDGEEDEHKTRPMDLTEMI